MLRIITFTIAIICCSAGFSQTFGPNNPGVFNIFGAGNNWTGGNLLLSNNNYANCTLNGVTNSLRTRQYGFNLLSTDIVQGIRLEIEKKGNAFNNVSLLNGWQDGELSTITNYPLSAGTNRMMVLYIGMENGVAPIINSVTYGGLNMTQLISINNSTSFDAQLEVWYLTEAQLATLAPGNYNVQANLGVFVQNQYFDILSAATFQNVDPISPFLDIQTGNTSGGTPNPLQLPNPLNVGIGGVAINGIFCGNNSTPAVTNGGTNCWTINSGFTEGTDVYRANTAVAANTGGCFQSAHKFIAATGTEQPSTTFNGSPNRRIVIAISLRRASIVDVTVMLQKNGITVGNNLAQTATYWPLSDTYVAYGGPTNLWGTTWNFSDINNVNFGAFINARIYNGRAEVDHMRITVFTQSVLPIELIDFFALSKEHEVECSWLTASELNSDYYLIQRSPDGFVWEDLGKVLAAGNSNDLLSYSYIDDRPLSNISYYRLKQVDLDGQFEYSDVKSVNRDSKLSAVYPNPTQNWANIRFEEKQESVQIVNALGQVIDAQSQAWFDSTYRFNIANQPDGVYFVILWDGTKKEVKRFVKQSALAN